MVLGLCRLLLRNPVEAEDAAQQVFLSAHRAVLGGAVPREAPAWLAAIARNECRARIRARMREPLPVPDLPSDLPDPVASAIRTVDLDALRNALSILPRRQRRAFLLRELGGLSYGELGQALGTSQSGVESLLFRARQHLRALLSGANAAAVPLALRDELARLIPGFDPGSLGLAARVAAIPLTLKLATAAAGVGAVTAGALELPQHHARPPETQAPVASPSVAAPEPSERPKPVLLAQRSSRTPGAERHAPARRLEAQTEGRSEHGQGQAEPRQPAEIEREPAAVRQSNDDSNDSPKPQDQPDEPDGSGD